MLRARILADLVVMLHALYVAFVVLGMAAILIGIALGRAGPGTSGFASSTCWRWHPREP